MAAARPTVSSASVRRMLLPVIGCAVALYWFMTHAKRAIIGPCVCVGAASVMMHLRLKGLGWQVVRVALLVAKDMLTDKSTASGLLSNLLQLLCAAGLFLSMTSPAVWRRGLALCAVAVLASVCVARQEWQLLVATTALGMAHVGLHGRGWQVVRMALLLANEHLRDKSTASVMLTGLIQLLCLVDVLCRIATRLTPIPGQQQQPSTTTLAKADSPASTPAAAASITKATNEQQDGAREASLSTNVLFPLLRPPNDQSARQAPFCCTSKARDVVPIGFTPMQDGVYLITDNQDHHTSINYADTQIAASCIMGQALHTLLGALQCGPIDICPSLMRFVEESPILAHTVQADQCLLALPFDEARGWGVSVYPLLTKGSFGGMSMQRGMGGGKREATHCGIVIGTPERLINGVGHVGRASRLGVFVEWERKVRDCEREVIKEMAQAIQEEDHRCLLVGLLPLTAIDMAAIFPSPLHTHIYHDAHLLSAIVTPPTAPSARPRRSIRSMWHTILRQTGCIDSTLTLPAESVGLVALGMVAQEKREHDHKTPREVDTAGSVTPMGGGGGGVWCDANTVDSISESELEGGVSEEAVTDQEGKCADGGVSEGCSAASACLFEAAYLAAYVLLLSGIWQPIQALLLVVFTLALPPTSRPLLSAVPLGGLIMTIIVATFMTCGDAAITQTATLISGWLTVVLVSLASSGAKTDGPQVVRATCVLAGSVAALALWTNLYMALPAMPILSIISSCWFPLFGVTIASGTARWLAVIDYGGAESQTTDLKPIWCC